MFKNVRYIDPKLFQEDGQPRYNINLEPSDWKSFTSFTDTDMSVLGLSNSHSTSYEIKQNIENGFSEVANEKVIYDKVFGIRFDATLNASNNTFLGADRVIVFSGDSFLFGQKSFSYSFWYYKGEEASGTLFSIQNGDSSNACLYIDNGILYFYNGVETLQITEIDDRYFNKKGVKSPLHVCVTYDFDESFLSIFLDGEYYGMITAIDLVCNMLVFGGSTVGGVNRNLDGTIKWIRTYDRALTEIEVLSLYSEFDNCPGNGVTWTQPLGSIPNEFENDTAYVIRRYNDDTKTYIQDNTSEIDSVGIFACPDDSNSIDVDLSDKYSQCPWIGESGEVIIQQYSSDSSIKSETIKKFMIKNIEIRKHQESSSYIFIFNSNAPLGYIYIDNCRFSSDGCSIDINDEYNKNAGRYLISYGEFNDFILKNCEIVNTNIDYDAFRFTNCNNAVIRRVNVYSSPSTSGITSDIMLGPTSYNSSCFSFMNCSSNSDGRYTNFYNNSTGGLLRNLDMKNVEMFIRGRSDSQLPGLVLSTNCSRAKIDNINIHQAESIEDNVSNIVSYNGLINLRWMYDYDIKNITVNVPLIKKIQYWPLVMFAVTESKQVSVSQGAAQRRIIDNINISIGQDDLDTNLESQVNYFPTSNNTYNGTILGSFPLYSLFCVMSNDDPAHGIHIVKNCSVTSPTCSAIALSNVFGDFKNVEGNIRVAYARLDVNNLISFYNKSIINIWDNAELNIENLTVTNPEDNDLITYNSTSSDKYITSHVFVRNSNCSIQRNSYDKSGTGENNAFIYCPNTVIKNGFQMRGMSHVILPVNIHREYGHEISLRLHKNGSQSTEFRFPPEPYTGIAYDLTSGKRKMTIHFAEAESSITDKTYIDMLENLWIEVVTDNDVYNSKINGEWKEDSDVWSSKSVKPFKFMLDIVLEKNEKVFVRVYYNVDTHVNGGLFLDPKIDWE